MNLALHLRVAARGCEEPRHPGRGWRCSIRRWWSSGWSSLEPRWLGLLGVAEACWELLLLLLLLLRLLLLLLLLRLLLALLWLLLRLLLL